MNQRKVGSKSSLIAFFLAVSSPCRALIDIFVFVAHSSFSHSASTLEGAIVRLWKSLLKLSLSAETISGFINLLDSGILTPQMFDCVKEGD